MKDTGRKTEKTGNKVHILYDKDTGSKDLYQKDKADMPRKFSIHVQINSE